MRGIITVRDRSGREVWAGSYGDFERQFADSLSVSELCAVYNERRLAIGARDGRPPLTISLDFPTFH